MRRTNSADQNLSYGLQLLPIETDFSRSLFSAYKIEFIPAGFVFVKRDRYPGTFRHYAATERRLDALYIICDLKLHPQFSYALRLCV